MMENSSSSNDQLPDLQRPQKQISFRGIHTEVYERKPTTGPPSPPLIAVIPGNPGVITFYEKFIDHLFSQLEERFHIIGIAHAGHGAKGMNEGRLFSVEEQIQHKIDVLSDLVADSPERPIVLIGHSIGSYVSLKVKRRSKQLNIIRSYHLMPTFRHLGQGLHPFVKVMVKPGARHAAALMAHYCPSFLVSQAINRTGLPEEARIITTGHLDYHIVLNILYMAHTEEQDVLEMDEEVRGIIEENLDSHYFLYGRTDRYTPLSFVEDLKSVFPTAKVQLAEDGIAHAFVLHHSLPVAETLLPDLRSSLSSSIPS